MTTKNKGTSIKAITHSLMCEMQATPEYVGWLNALRETTDKLVRAEGENKRLQTQATNATKGKDLAQTMLAAEMAKHKTTRDKLATVEGEVKFHKERYRILEQTSEVEIKAALSQESAAMQNAKAEIKRLKHELHKAQSNTQNIPTNGSQDALDALKRILQVDTSGRNAWTAHKEMQAIAKEVLGE